MLYKIKGKVVEKVDQTELVLEELLEKNLEDWIEHDPSILGEELLIIGRQVQIPEVNDRIDLLALDPLGNVVIIELKKGILKEPVDFQSLRYASYVSRWEYDDLEKQANNYFSEKGEKEFNFIEKFEEFCSSLGIDETPDLNQDQRIIIVGSKLNEKLGSVALWLRKHSVDIKIIEVSLFKDNESLFLFPQVILPISTTEKFEIGKHAYKQDRPWLTDGEEWHLNKRCGEEIKDKLIQINSIINENFDTVEGPIWNQKFYVSFKERNHIWISIKTRKTLLVLNATIKKGDMDAKKISETLCVSESSGLVEIRDKNSYYDTVILKIDKEFDVTSDSFLKFLKDCYESFNKV